VQTLGYNLILYFSIYFLRYSHYLGFAHFVLSMMFKENEEVSPVISNMFCLSQENDICYGNS